MTLRVALITSSARRHMAMASMLSSSGYLASLIIQKRDFRPARAHGLPENLWKLTQRHFQLRDSAESLFFGNPGFVWDGSEIVDQESLNSDRTVRIILGSRPDLVITWGCGLLEDKVISNLSVPIWNFHGGLSPNYRGAITMFWPSYHLEPQMTGTTIHEVTTRVDGGPIIHQTPASLVKSDGIQMLSARAVDSGLQDLIQILKDSDNSRIPSGTPQKTNGKIWKNSDWHPRHLLPVYEFFEDRIIAYLQEDGGIPPARGIISGISKS